MLPYQPPYTEIILNKYLHLVNNINFWCICRESTLLPIFDVKIRHFLHMSRLEIYHYTMSVCVGSQERPMIPRRYSDFFTILLTITYNVKQILITYALKAASCSTTFTVELCKPIFWEVTYLLLIQPRF